MCTLNGVSERDHRALVRGPAPVTLPTRLCWLQGAALTSASQGVNCGSACRVAGSIARLNASLGLPGR